MKMRRGWDLRNAASPTRFFSVLCEKLEISIRPFVPTSVRLFLERGAVVSDVVPPEVPLVLHLLLTDLAVHLPPHRVHVQDVLRISREMRWIKLMNDA